MIVIFLLHLIATYFACFSFAFSFFFALQKEEGIDGWATNVTTAMEDKGKLDGRVFTNLNLL